MIKFFKNANFYNYLFLFIMCVFITVIYAYCCKECTFWGDDFIYARVYRNLEYLTCLTFELHGNGYIGVFLCKALSSGLPLILNIHPYDFVGFYHGLFRGFFVSLMLLAIARFINVYAKSNKLYIINFILLTIFFFWTFVVEYCSFTDIIYKFYRYIFVQIFFSIFWFYIFKSILNKESTRYSNLKLAALCCCGYIIGTAVELVYFTSALLVSLIAAYNIFLLAVNKFFKNKSFYADYKFNLNINFYLPAAFLFLAILLSTTSSGFHSVAHEQRGLFSTVINLDLIKEFTGVYIYLLIKKYYVFCLYFLSTFIIALSFSLRKKEYKEILVPVLLTISIYTVMFSLVLCGKTFDGETFWLLQPEVILLYKFIMIYPLIILISYIIKQTETGGKFIKWSCSSFIILATILFFIYKFFIIYNNEESSLFFIRPIKIRNYQIEKIIRFYTLQKRTAKIPAFLAENELSSLKETTFHGYIQLVSDSKTYRDKNILEYGYIITDDNTFETFYKDGGAFTSDEISDIKFSRLFDKDFVLNQKK